MYSLFTRAATIHGSLSSLRSRNRYEFTQLGACGAICVRFTPDNRYAGWCYVKGDTSALMQDFNPINCRFKYEFPI